MTLVATKLSEFNFYRLNRKELANLSTTTWDLFHFISELDKLNDIRGEVTAYFLIYQLQSTETDKCNIFLLIFMRTYLRVTKKVR